MGLPYTDKYSSKIKEHLSVSAAKRSKIKEQKKSKAVHEYHPEDYGLTAQLIRDDFAAYISKYGL